MDNGFITVVTPTVGIRSPNRLSVLLSDMRRFTKLEYRHIVCDDGTISDSSRNLAENICASFGAEYILNYAPFGVFHTLNKLFDKVKTKWAYLVDDGVRPSQDWLEAAVEFCTKIGSKTWCGRRIAMAGVPAIPAQMMALGGMFGNGKNINGFLNNHDDCIDDFYGDWNDGNNSIKRIIKQIKERVLTTGCLDNGQEIIFRDMFVARLDPPGNCDDPNLRIKMLMLFDTNHIGGFWPERNIAHLHWYGSPLAIIDVDLCKSLGGWRKDCWFYEGHLAVRFGLKGHLVVMVEQPPWIHMGNIASKEALVTAHQPRVLNEPDTAFIEDFGVSHSVCQVLLEKAIPLEERVEINRLFVSTPLDTVFER